MGGAAVPCLCKHNSCHDLFLYFSIQAEPRKMGAGWGKGRGELFVVDFACTEEKLHSHTQAAPSLCVLLHKHNSEHAGIHWLKYMQKAVLGTASLCFTHE